MYGRVNTRARQLEALRLRSQGKDFRTIASELGYAGPSGAHKSVTKALQDAQHEQVAELRTLHSLRVSELLAALWPQRKNAQTARAILAALEREARMYGLDSPTRLQLQEVLRSEDWARVKAVIVAALVDWPEARERVIEGLRGLGDD